MNSLSKLNKLNDRFKVGDILNIEWLGKTKVIIDDIYTVKSINGSFNYSLVRLDRSGKKLSGDENTLTLSKNELLKLVKSN